MSLPCLDDHPHARAVLGPAVRAPSHAYLLHGPAGSGKREAARAFAAELLAEGSADPDNARARVRSGVHPDLTWVTPSGAHEMLRSDVDEAVVAAASHTPFEASRRVFVLEGADTMNDEAANRLLKTLEEPPSYVVLLLLTSRLSDVLPTIASRCQAVRFDPLPAERIAHALDGVPAEVAHACARLSLGDVEKARALATPEGAGLRSRAEALAVAACMGRIAAARPWAPLLSEAAALGAAARDALDEAWRAEQELLSVKDRRRREREVDQQKSRAERRARTRALDHGLELCGLWFRDLACLAAGVPELVANVDRLDALRAAEPAARPAGAYREATELVEDTRLRLLRNVTEELACEALAYRLERVLAPAG